jgi:hypothetical protein
MDANWNNIMLEHRGHRVSIAQHSFDGRVNVQEVMVWGPRIDDEIFTFSATPTSLVVVLDKIMRFIDEGVESE